MNLEQAKAFTDKKVDDGFISDGCTGVPDLGIKRFCVMHDCLRVFKPVSASQADWLFFKGICSKGKRYTPIAVLYYIGVRIQSTVGYLGLSITILTLIVLALIKLKEE